MGFRITGGDMARVSFNALVFPYIRVGGDFEYALLKRSDAGF